MLITVVNQVEGLVQNARVLEVIRAISRQVYYDFEPYWHLSAKLRLAINRKPPPGPPSRIDSFMSDLAGDLKADTHGAVIQMDPVAGGALLILQRWADRPPIYNDFPYCYGLHDMYGVLQFPVGYVFVTTEKGSFRAADWSVTLSHEILEVIANPHVNLLVEAPYPGPRGGETPQRVFVEREVCDPVKDSWYVLDDGIKVSNFVLPLYFVEGGDRDERVDFLGALDCHGDPLRSFGMLEGGYVPFYDPYSRPPGKAMVQRLSCGKYVRDRHPGVGVHRAPPVRGKSVPTVNRRPTPRGRSGGPSGRSG